MTGMINDVLVQSMHPLCSREVSVQADKIFSKTRQECSFHACVMVGFTTCGHMLKSLQCCELSVCTILKGPYRLKAIFKRHDKNQVASEKKKTPKEAQEIHCFGRVSVSSYFLLQIVLARLTY